MIDPYVYEGTNILKNKLGILNEAELEKTETEYAIVNIDFLKHSPFEMRTIFDGLRIHQIIFEDVYEWAGKPRTIDIYKAESLLGGKSIDYVFASYINQALTELQQEFAMVKWEELELKEKIEKVCYFVSEFWHIHPFREGNTRTSAMMLYFLIKKAGLHINSDYLSKNGKYFRNALALSCLYSSSKPEYLFGIVEDSVTVKNVSSKKYETINGIEVEKYSYTNHTSKKMKTIKKPEDWRKWFKWESKYTVSEK